MKIKAKKKRVVLGVDPAKMKKHLKEEIIQEAFTPEEEDEIREIVRKELPYVFYKLYLRRKSWT